MAMGITVTDLVERSRARLLGPKRGRLVKMALQTTASTSLTVQYGGSVRPGDYLGTEYELQYVWTAQGDEKIVERGQLGTTAVQHAVDTVAEVNPRFPRGVVLQTIQDELLSWPHSLYGVETLDLSIGANEDAIDFEGVDDFEFYRLLKVEREPDTGSEQWVELYADTDLADVASFPSGRVLRFRSTLGRAYALRVTFARKLDFSTFAAGVDLEDFGMSRRMADIPILGCIARLLPAGEVARTDLVGEGQMRDAEEVPPGHRLRTGEWFWQLRDRRIADEVRELNAVWGWGYRAL